MHFKLVQFFIVKRKKFNYFSTTAVLSNKQRENVLRVLEREKSLIFSFVGEASRLPLLVLFLFFLSPWPFGLRFLFPLANF